MPDLEALKRRIREHPAAQGGPADVTYCLDLLQVTLKMSFVPLAGQAALCAAVHHRNPQMWFAYIAVSREDPFAWAILQALLRRLKHETPESLSASEEQLPIFRVGFDALNDWAREVASGELQKPTRPGRDRRKLQMENAAIVATVNFIRDHSDLPYEGEDGSACQVVADRLGMTYATVRTKWQNGQPLLRRARESGRIPPAKKRTRRRGSTANTPKNTGGFSA
ncbi:MAG: hypothetical protein OXC11_10430 [Rhodospirillales bacterium]|nr:hypothetical protein [Rhodospirillales bacterium]